MTRRSDIWVINIRSNQIHHSFDGPGGPGPHRARHVGNPWFASAGEDTPDLHASDIVIVRQVALSGSSRSGVAGLWRFSEFVRAKSKYDIPWTDRSYHWILYFEPIQRRFDTVFIENWELFPFDERDIESSIVSLTPADAYVYLREILRHDCLSSEARRTIKQRYNLTDELQTSSTKDQPRSNTAEQNRRTTEVDRRIRDGRLVNELKETYSNTCQLCGQQRLQSSTKAYSEVHHIKPLGRPHNGPDQKRNMLVLCPNHHADFDSGTVAADPKTHTILHLYDTTVYKRLQVEDGHNVSEEFLQYHIDIQAVGSLSLD